MPKPNHPQLWLHPKSMTAPLNMHAACVCSHHPSQRPHMVHFSTAQPGQPECSQNNNTPTAHNCTDHSSLYSIHHHILANLCNARTNKSLQQLHMPLSTFCLVSTPYSALSHNISAFSQFSAKPCTLFLFFFFTPITLYSSLFAFDLIFSINVAILYKDLTCSLCHVYAVLILQTSMCSSLHHLLSCLTSVLLCSPSTFCHLLLCLHQLN
jgi:hypothetical protein